MGADVAAGRGAVLLRGVDRAMFAAALADRLRTAGVECGPQAAERFAAALAVTRPTSRSALYWTARPCLVHDRADLATFDLVFAAVFELAAMPNRHDRLGFTQLGGAAQTGEVWHRAVKRDGEPAHGHGLPWTARPTITGLSEEVEDEDDLGLPDLLPSELAGLADRPFDELDPDDLAALGRWIEAHTAAWPTRRSRRRGIAHHRGRLAHRRTLAAARRTGGEPLRLVRDRPSRRPRRLVVLADVSGSMTAVVRPYLHLLRALGTTRDAEVFMFATRLTRITPALRHRSAEEAIRRASDQVGDRFGGTRIATSLGELLAHPSWSNVVRGAVVAIASDGWDTDPPEQLARRMARLHRMAHKVVWINPRMAAPGFAPTVGGMAAALPHCDAALPGHSLRAMQDVIAALVAAR